VLDLSVGSLLLEDRDSWQDSHSLSRLLAEAMERAGATLGVGRYDEARLLYSAGQFDATYEELPERRTVHLGLDLFAAVGTPVVAALDGLVWGMAANEGVQDYGPTITLKHITDEGVPFYTLYGHLTRSSLSGLQPGDAVRKGQEIGAIGDSPENGDWPAHLHFQLITDLLGERQNFPGVTAPTLRDVWTSICPDPNLIVGIPGSCFPPADRRKDEIVALRRANLGKSLSLSYSAPLKIVRGMGQYLYDESGRAYLDVVNNVCHVGHGHPHVVKAASRQMAVLNTNTRYLHDNIVAYAEKLLATFPDPLNVCFFVCSGSEANELALRMARAYTRQQDIITVDGAYHGNTQALIDISPYKFDGPGGTGAPAWVHVAQMPDGYRGPIKGQGLEAGRGYGAHVGTIVQGLLDSGRGPAAFICESVLGCGGQIVLPQGYMDEAFRHVRSAGGVAIADEVQVGFGRIGSHFWAFEEQEVVPDIVTMGKPIGNGHPLAAVVTTAEIAYAFANGMEYFNTFGGNPVSCAVGSAVLEVIERERLQENALHAGGRLIAGLSELASRHELIGDVRGLGLFAGVELVLDRETLIAAGEHASHIANRMKEHGILISTDGPLHNVLKMKPPIVFDAENADRVVETLDKILHETCLQV
jgi:4-aminobutyrate aminotransferase-like enzyme